jgi:orotate phosphoribosyltransferase
MTYDLEHELQARGGILKGHFQYASGRHGDIYVEKFRILQWPDVTGEACGRIAEAFAGKANLVAGPTTGGIIMAYETARHLGLRSIIAERCEDGPGREFRRGFEIGPGDRVLIADDVLTTGGSIREVIDAVQARGAELVGVGVLVDRTGGRVDFGVPLFACLELPVASWAPDECAQCKDGVPLVVT